MSFHNHRNSLGKFTRRVARTADGKFKSRIVSGRLYDYRGATVRALEKAGDYRLVSFHKTLFGYVQDRELSKVNTRKVKKYLAAA